MLSLVYMYYNNPCFQGKSMKNFIKKIKRYFFSITAKANRFYWDSIRCHFIPQQKWLTSSIPKTWCDKPELISDVLFTILIDFVERERGLENISYQVIHARDSTSDDFYNSKKRHDDYMEVCKDLTLAYQFAKQRDALENAIHEPIDKDDLDDISKALENPEFTKKLDKINELEKEFKKQEETHLLSILKHKDYMWT